MRRHLVTGSGTMATATLPEETVPRVSAWRLYGFLSRLALRHPFLLAVAVVASIGVALAGIVSLSLVLPLMQTITGSALALPEGFPLAFMMPLFAGLDTASAIRLAAILLICITIVRGAMSFAESRVSSYLRILVDRDIRQLVYDEMMSIELRHLQKRRTADLQMLLHQYPRQSADILDQYLSALTKAVSGLTYLSALLLLSVWLTLLGVVLALVSFAAVQGLTALVRRIAGDTNVLRAMLSQTSLDSIQGMRVIRLFGREREASERFGRTVRELRRASYRGASVAALVPPVQGIVSMALFGTLIVVATYVLPAGDPGWVATLLTFMLVMARLAGPASGFAKRRTKISAELPALEEIVTFLGTPKPVLKDGTRPFSGLRSHVALEGVSFAYDPEGAPALSGVSMRFERGRTTAIVGASGSGKSTLLGLLARLADPDVGRVAVDGVDLRELQTAHWRHRLAFVSQENYLFNDTVRNNLVFARPDATDAQVEAAARRAHAHDFIMALENGYDTPLGDRGTRLSGGQAQRLAIARALLVDPEILVLDEATSALDTRTERDVQDAIEEACRGRTVIVVAHRLSTVRLADRIYVLEQGLVVEEGTHDELLLRGGRYREYVDLQDLSAARRVPADRADPEDRLPARRVPVEIPRATPVRLVVDAARRTAIVVETSGSRRAVRLADSSGLPEGDVALLRAGDLDATVALDGSVHEGVPIFGLRADGTEFRSRVAKIRL
jgi:subfamily B ATP-binding cassette protein MsbA